MPSRLRQRHARRRQRPAPPPAAPAASPSAPTASSPATAAMPATPASTSPPLSQVINRPAGSSNVALASAGAVASASSTYSAGYPVAAVNNNERAGVNWGNGGGWNDATAERLPGLGADRLQRQQDHRSRRRLYAAGQLQQSGRAHRHPDLQPLRHHRLHRRRAGTARPGSPWPPSAATTWSSAPSTSPPTPPTASASTSPTPCQSTPASPKSRPGTCGELPTTTTRSRSSAGAGGDGDLHRHGAGSGARPATSASPWSRPILAARATLAAGGTCQQRQPGYRQPQHRRPLRRRSPPIAA